MLEPEQALRSALRDAYEVCDGLGMFVIAIFETREMGENEMALAAAGQITQYRTWVERRLTV